mgnify:CR=1 FL=1
MHRKRFGRYYRMLVELINSNHSTLWTMSGFTYYGLQGLLIFLRRSRTRGTKNLTFFLARLYLIDNRRQQASISPAEVEIMYEPFTRLVFLRSLLTDRVFLEKQKSKSSILWHSQNKKRERSHKKLLRW